MNADATLQDCPLYPGLAGLGALIRDTPSGTQFGIGRRRIEVVTKSEQWNGCPQERAALAIWDAKDNPIPASVDRLARWVVSMLTHTQFPDTYAGPITMRIERAIPVGFGDGLSIEWDGRKYGEIWMGPPMGMGTAPREEDPTWIARALVKVAALVAEDLRPRWVKEPKYSVYGKGWEWEVRSEDPNA